MDRICWWYTDMLAQRGPGSAKPIPVAAPPRSAPPVKPQPVARPRRMTFKDRHALETLPERIAALQREVARLNALLADLDLYARDPARFDAITKALGTHAERAGRGGRAMAQAGTAARGDRGLATFRRINPRSVRAGSSWHQGPMSANARFQERPISNTIYEELRNILRSRSRICQHVALSLTTCAGQPFALGILEAASTGGSAARECCYDLARKLTEPLSCDRPLRDRPAHDERLWTGITKANGALGNTSCLVGTAEQVADSLLAYHRLSRRS